MLMEQRKLLAGGEAERRELLSYLSAQQLERPLEETEKMFLSALHREFFPPKRIVTMEAIMAGTAALRVTKQGSKE